MQFYHCQNSELSEISIFIETVITGQIELHTRFVLGPSHVSLYIPQSYLF